MNYGRHEQDRCDGAAITLIRTKDEAEQWLEAPAEEAMTLQKPASEDAIVLLPQKNDD